MDDFLINFLKDLPINENQNERKAYKFYSEKYKEKILSLGALMTEEKIADQEHIRLSTVHSILKRGTSTDGRIHNGRPIEDEERDSKIISWFKEARDLGLPIGNEMLRKKAKELSSDPSFKASKGWL